MAAEIYLKTAVNWLMKKLRDEDCTIELVRMVDAEKRIFKLFKNTLIKLYGDVVPKVIQSEKNEFKDELIVEKTGAN